MKQLFSIDTPFADGVVVPIDKPLGWTSADVVRRVKVLLRRLGHKSVKIGHAGTLDPLASGILLICIGKATKQAEALQSEQKEYLTTVRLGATTPSYDLEHPIDQAYPFEHITEEALCQTLKDMCGEQLQIPPIYSAKLIDGKRAYEYARQGEEVEMRKALVNIYDIKLEEFTLPDVTIRITCSKGTYVRSIARDLGEKLGSGGHLIALCRTRSGNYSLENSLSIEDVGEMLTPASIE